MWRQPLVFPLTHGLLLTDWVMTSVKYCSRDREGEGGRWGWETKIIFGTRRWKLYLLWQFQTFHNTVVKSGGSHYDHRWEKENNLWLLLLLPRLHFCLHSSVAPYGSVFMWKTEDSSSSSSSSSRVGAGAVCHRFTSPSATGGSVHQTHSEQEVTVAVAWELFGWCLQHVGGREGLGLNYHLKRGNGMMIQLYLQHKDSSPTPGLQVTGRTRTISH